MRPSTPEAGKALARLCLQEPAEHPPDVYRHPLDQSQAVPPGLSLPLLLQSKLSQIKNKSNLLEHKQPALIYFKHQDLLKLNKVPFNPISPKVHWFFLSGIPDSHRPNIPSLTLSFADERITNFVFWQVAGRTHRLSQLWQEQLPASSSKITKALVNKKTPKIHILITV